MRETFDDGFPKVGQRVGTRTVICVKGGRIVFGEREGDTENCGAYLTNLREWIEYELSLGSAQ